MQRRTSGCKHVVRPLGAQTIFPGHGAVAGPDLIDDVLGYLRFVQAGARAGRDAGLTPLATAHEPDLRQLRRDSTRSPAEVVGSTAPAPPRI